MKILVKVILQQQPNGFVMKCPECGKLGAKCVLDPRKQLSLSDAVEFAITEFDINAEMFAACRQHLFIILP